MRLDYIYKVLVNSGITFAFGYLMWKLEIWSAGDSKLVFLFSFLLPLKFYSHGYTEYFPAFSLVINIFAVSITAVLARIIFGTAQMIFGGAFGMKWKDVHLRERALAAKKVFAERWVIFAVMFAIFNVIFLFMRFVQSGLKGGELTVLVNIAFLVFMYAAIGPISAKVESVFKKQPKLKALAVAVIVAALYFLMKDREVAVRVGNNAKMIAGFMIFVGVSKKLVEMYLKKSDVTKVTVKDLRPGLVPTEEARKQISESVELSPIFMDGLSEEQVGLIKGALTPETELAVTTTIPFAPMAFAGVILTILIEQSVIHFITALAK